MTKQSEALRLADKLDHQYKYLLSGKSIVVDPIISNATLELRRLHEVNQVLRNALLAIREYRFMPSADNQVDAENKFKEALRLLGESNE